MILRPVILRAGDRLATMMLADANHDGKLSREEAPPPLSERFGELDADGLLTPDEVRGFSHPRHRLSPKKPHATNFTKQAYQTNPIPTASDNAIAPATGRPPPPVTPKTHPVKSAKPVYQTDPIPKTQSRSTSYGHLPRTESRISPAPAAIENHP